MSLFYAFDPHFDIVHSSGRFRRARRPVRYAVAAALTGFAYFLATFGAVAGAIIAAKTFR